MNNVPAVYVPTQPEGDGLTMPTLLSLLAHGIILGVLIYTYQTPTLEIAGSIETTMVTPGELAEIQGQILANRAALAEQAASASSAAGQMQMSESDSSDMSDQSAAQSSSPQEPVFTRSDEPASRPMLMSEEQHQKRLEQMAEYNRNIAEAAAALDGTQALEEFQQQQEDERIEEDRELRDFRAKANNQPRVNKPTRGDRNINIELGGSSSAGKTFDLADGQSTVTGGSSSAATSNTSSGGSRGASNSEIVNLIRRNYSPPVGAKGSTQRTTLSITVSANGDVISVSASGANEAVNEAAKQAVRSVGRLPIDVDDPKYPTFTIQFNGSN
ncbi:MAG: TonB C-terminal domain-containing protein [Psychrobacter sp.]|nr:TonB C-terminal domain-containing protein [Psychrobacter sp.]